MSYSNFHDKKFIDSKQSKKSYVVQIRKKVTLTVNTTFLAISCTKQVWL